MCFNDGVWAGTSGPTHTAWCDLHLFLIPGFLFSLSLSYPSICSSLHLHLLLCLLLSFPSHCLTLLRCWSFLSLHLLSPHGSSFLFKSSLLPGSTNGPDRKHFQTSQNFRVILTHNPVRLESVLMMHSPPVWITLWLVSCILSWTNMSRDASVTVLKATQTYF